MVEHITCGADWSSPQCDPQLLSRTPAVCVFKALYRTEGTDFNLILRTGEEMVLPLKTFP